MIVLRIPTQLGAIQVRRRRVRAERRFWWRWRSGDVWNGPFDHLIECLSDLSAAYELALDAELDAKARERRSNRPA